MVSIRFRAKKKIALKSMAVMALLPRSDGGVISAQNAGQQGEVVTRR